MSAHDEQATASRRSILGGAVGAGALGLVGAGAAGLASAGPASAHGTITTYAAINGARTVYEVNGALTAWGYRPSFHDRLNSWLAFWNANTPASYADASRVWGYGAHTDHRVTEAHNSGRGFDLSRIYTGSTRRFTARYDIWSDLVGQRPHDGPAPLLGDVGLRPPPLPQRPDLPLQLGAPQPHPHRQPRVGHRPVDAQHRVVGAGPARPGVLPLPLGAAARASTACGARRRRATRRGCCARRGSRAGASRRRSRAGSRSTGRACARATGRSPTPRPDHREPA